MPDLEKFDIEYQFQFYLEKVKLNPKTMSPVQYRETKRAFVAGISAMLVLIIEEKPGADEFAQQVEKMLTQCAGFWKKEMTNYQSKFN